MDFTMAYVMAGLGTIISLFWIFLFFRYGKRFNDVISAVDSKEFFLPELFFIGMGAIALFKIDMQSLDRKKKEKEISEIRGEKFAPFYAYITFSGQITYALTLAPLGFFFGAMANDMMIGLGGIVVSALLVFYLDIEIKNAVGKRRDELLKDFPQMTSKLVLLLNAGMILREAWKRVAFSGEGVLYEEMRLTCDDLDNGVSEIRALEEFSQRCFIKEIKKFSSIITQNMQKGSAELVRALRQMSSESWEQKKRMVKIKGDLAGQKLMIPTGIMFFGILLLIVVPAFMSFNF